MDRWSLLKAFIQCQLRSKDMFERLLSWCLICWFLQYNLCETGGCLHRRAAGSVSAACGWDSSQSSLLRLQHRWWVCFAGPAENESGSWGRPAVFQTGCKLWKQLCCRFGIYFHPDSSSLFDWLVDGGCYFGCFLPFFLCFRFHVNRVEYIQHKDWYCDNSKLYM